jgi:hypothetical protein
MKKTNLKIKKNVLKKNIMGNSNSESDDRFLYETPIRDDLEYRVYNSSTNNDFQDWEQHQHQIRMERQRKFATALKSRKHQEKTELRKTLKETKHRIDQMLKDQERMKEWEEDEELKRVSKLFNDDLDKVNQEKLNEARMHLGFTENDEYLEPKNGYRP